VGTVGGGENGDRGGHEKMDASRLGELVEKGGGQK